MLRPKMRSTRSANALLIGWRRPWREIVDHRAADLAHDPNATCGTSIDRALEAGDEENLNRKQRDAEERHPGLQIQHIGEDGNKSADLHKGLGDAHTDEAADRLRFRQDD
jgi:hypothetical protein